MKCLDETTYAEAHNLHSVLCQDYAPNGPEADDAMLQCCSCIVAKTHCRQHGGGAIADEGMCAVPNVVQMMINMGKTKSQIVEAIKAIHVKIGDKGMDNPAAKLNPRKLRNTIKQEIREVGATKVGRP